MRLEKYLALAGISSRRGSKEVIREGRVSVNGAMVTETGFSVDESADRVVVDGSRVRLQLRHRYVLLNKPAGYLCTVQDTHGRKTVYDLLPRFPERIVPVGRLDAETEGLLLLTNDGELAFRLTHPRFKIPKVYSATVKGEPTEEAVKRLREGVYIEGGKTAPAQVEVLFASEKESRLKLTLHEGRKREVRLMCLVAGLPVKKLKRVQLGPLSVARLPKGGFRELSQKELAALKKAVGMDEKAAA